MKVMTYNIRGGLGMDGVRSIERVAETILAHRPDIICLQEVHLRIPWSGFVNQPLRLKKLLGMDVRFMKCVNLGLGGAGVIIASCFPIVKLKKHFLPSVRERRGLLEAHITTPQASVAVFCTHWGLDNEERMRQSSVTARAIRECRLPIVLCGDMNEGPEGIPVKALLQKTSLADAGESGNLATYPADGARARIDYILHSLSLTPVKFGQGEQQTSDHLPIIAEF